MSGVSVNLKTPAGAGSGHRHWWWQRVSATLLAPLALWFAGSIALLDLGSVQVVRGWLAQPLHGALCGLLVVSAALHSALGVQSVLTDYVDRAGRRAALLAGSTALHALVVAIAFASLVRLLVFGAADAG